MLLKPLVELGHCQGRAVGPLYYLLLWRHAGNVPTLLRVDFSPFRQALRAAYRRPSGSLRHECLPANLAYRLRNFPYTPSAILHVFRLVALLTKNGDVLWGVVRRVPVFVVALKGRCRTTRLALRCFENALRCFPSRISIFQFS